jgi:hypothetical protein
MEKGQKPSDPSVIHHRQNPLESTCHANLIFLAWVQLYELYIPETTAVLATKAASIGAVASKEKKRASMFLASLFICTSSKLT